MLHSTLMLGVGLTPVVLSVIGLWNYAERGYVLSRAGERMHDAWALLYVAYVLVGLAVVGHAVRYYRRHG